MSELLLMRAVVSPIKTVFDRHRHYQQWEFNGAVVDFFSIMIAMLLVGVLAVLAQ